MSDRQTLIEAIDGQLRYVESISPSEPLREGIQETPVRVADAWFDFWGAGYRVDVDSLLKTFLDGADGVDEMIVVKNIPLYSHCEHHLAAIFGTATVAYIPNGRIVGLSKINRVVDAFARRLQVQERLTAQIAEAIDRNLKPIGVGVQVRARHLCMESRGVCQQGHSTITNALKGAIKTDAKARAEFLAACNGG
jgi:GTP cyclohydrolase I